MLASGTKNMYVLNMYVCNEKYVFREQKKKSEVCILTGKRRSNSGRKKDTNQAIHPTAKKNSACKKRRILGKIMYRIGIPTMRRKMLTCMSIRQWDFPHANV